MRMRAIFEVLLAVTAILVCLGGSASSAQAGPQWTLEMTNSIDPFEGDVFIRGPQPAQANIWTVTITQTGDAPTSGPITFTDTLPPGVKLVNIGHGSFYTCCGPLSGSVRDGRRSPGWHSAFLHGESQNSAGNRRRARTDPTGSGARCDVVRRRSASGLGGHVDQRIHTVGRRRTHRDCHRLGRRHRHGTVPCRKIRGPHHDRLRSPALRFTGMLQRPGNRAATPV